MRQTHICCTLIGLGIIVAIWRWLPANNLLELECLVPPHTDTCDALLLDGHNVTLLRRSFGCRTRQYNSKDTAACLERKRARGAIVFVGDSRMRNLYSGLVRLLNGNYSIEKLAGMHKSFSFAHAASNTTVKFFWAAYVDKVIIYYLHRLQTELPSLVVVGSALWTIKQRNASTLAFEEYQRNLTRVRTLCQSLANRGTVIWALQDPVLENNLAEYRRMITNKQIDVYNEVAVDTFCNSNVKLWASGREIALGLNSSVDGVHVSPHVVDVQMQNLLNYWCNSVFPLADLCCGYD